MTIVWWMGRSPTSSWQTSNNTWNALTPTTADICLPTSTKIAALEVRRLGVVPYGEALELQKALVEERRTGRVPNLLLLLQHPPVITLGVRKSSRANVAATGAQLAARGVEVHDTGRG